MKRIITITLITMAVIMSVGCKEKNENCNYSFPCYALEDEIWKKYFPYQVGQDLVFANQLGEELLFHVDSIFKCPDEYYITFDCDRPVECAAFKTVYLHSNTGLHVELTNVNAKMFSILFAELDFWEQSLYYTCETTDGIESAIGDTIFYTTTNVAQHINNAVQIKNIGLSSFYDVARQCVWNLVE